MAKELFGVDTDIILKKTMELAIVPIQSQIARKTLVEIDTIIVQENIIRTSRYRNSIVPTSMPTPENPDVEIASIDCPYAGALEYGTSKMKPRAVFRRAVEKVKNMLEGGG